MSSFTRVALQPPLTRVPEVQPVQHQQPCPYLGLVRDPAQHLDEPSHNHRCYHLDQQDQIDRTHQGRFCLTAEHRVCPWLMWRQPQKPAPSEHSMFRQRLTAWALMVAGLVLVTAGLGAGFSTGALARLWGQVLPSAPTAVAGLIPFPLPVDPDRVPTDLDALPTTPHAIPGTPLTTSIFTATAPRSTTASLSTTVDGLVVAGNVAFFFPREALSTLPGPVNVDVTANPPDVPVPGGMTRLGANNSLFGMRMTDGLGRRLTTLPRLATMIILYNHTDLAIARDDPNTLAAGYLLNDTSPAIANPLGLAAGTWLFFPPSLMNRDATSGTLIVQTQVVPSVASIIARPGGEVQTIVEDAPILSGPSAAARVLGRKKAFSRLLVVEPQIDRRLLVLDPDTDNYAFVNTTDIGLPILSSK